MVAVAAATLQDEAVAMARRTAETPRQREAVRVAVAARAAAAAAATVAVQAVRMVGVVAATAAPARAPLRRACLRRRQAA